MDNNVYDMIIFENDNNITFFFDYNRSDIYENILQTVEHESLLNNDSLIKNTTNLIEIKEIEASELQEKDTLCCICLDSFDSSCKVAKLDCDHFFHVKCIREWGYYKNCCPVCKKSINIINNNINT